MVDDAGGKTSQVEMIATRVCERQARFCAVVMDGIKENVAELTKKIDKLTETVTPLVTDIAILKTRWQLFGIVGVVVGAVGTIVGILIAIFD